MSVWTKTLSEPLRQNQRVYRLVLPRRGALLHNVLPLSLYLELRERFPYLTHSCKSQLNSSNSEKKLQTRLFPICAQGSCQDRGSLRDHPLTVDLRASSPLKTAGVSALLSSRSHLWCQRTETNKQNT